MAERRMFNKSLILSNSFLAMSAEARLLYVYLCLSADDDGFADNSQLMCLICGCKPDVLRELTGGGWVIAFDSGVVAITHWHIHNQLRRDRYKQTLYRDEYDKVCKNAVGAYVLRSENDGCRLVANLATQDRTDKDRIEKDSSDKDRIEKDSSGKDRSDQDRQEAVVSGSDIPDFDFDKLLSYYQAHCPSLAPCDSIDAPIRQKLLEDGDDGYLMANMVSAFLKAENTPFMRGEGAKGWQASLDWLADRHNRDRLLDGYYDSYRQ